MRTTKSVTISLPPAQLRVAERLAKKHSRTMSELFREGLRRLEQEERQPSPVALRDLRTVLQLLQREAKAKGLDKMSMREINTEVEAARKEMRSKKPASRENS